MNDTIYFDDWPCQKCKRPFSKHIKKGAPFEDSKTIDKPATENWCYTWEEIESDPTQNVKYWSFVPVDNLTYVEKVAEQKGIIK